MHDNPCVVSSPKCDKAGRCYIVVSSSNWRIGPKESLSLTHELFVIDPVAGITTSFSILDKDHPPLQPLYLGATHLSVAPNGKRCYLSNLHKVLCVDVDERRIGWSSRIKLDQHQYFPVPDGIGILGSSADGPLELLTLDRHSGKQVSAKQFPGAESPRLLTAFSKDSQILVASKVGKQYRVSSFDVVSGRETSVLMSNEIAEHFGLSPWDAIHPKAIAVHGDCFAISHRKRPEILFFDTGAGKFLGKPKGSATAISSSGDGWVATVDGGVITDSGERSIGAGKHCYGVAAGENGVVVVLRKSTIEVIADGKKLSASYEWNGWPPDLGCSEEADKAGIAPEELAQINDELAEQVAENPPEVPEDWEGGEWWIDDAVAGAATGVGHGISMAANAATFHQIDALDSFVDDVVAANGGLYGVANASAHIGVYSGYAAFVVAAYFPSTLYHFTSAAAADSIAIDGVITAGGGILGRGVYPSAFNSGFIARFMGAASTEAVIAIPAQGLSKFPTLIPGAWRIFHDVIL